MSNHSIVEHRATYHFIKVEEDYLIVCCSGKCSPHCKALILSIIEHWINTKRDKKQGEYVYLTLPQWVKHTYMLYARDVIIACIQELLDEGLILRRPFMLHGQNTFEYTLNLDVVHKQLKKLPLKAPGELMPNLDKYLEYKSNKKEAVEKSTTSKKTKGGRIIDGEVIDNSTARPSKKRLNVTSGAEPHNPTSERDGERSATPPTSPTLEDPSLSLIKNLFDAFNEERTRCFQEINEPFEAIAIPKPNSTEYKKFAVWAASGATEQDMRNRLHRFWDLRDKDGTHWWQKDKRLTLKAFCARDDVGNAPTNPSAPAHSQEDQQEPLTQQQCQSIDEEVRTLSERYQVKLVSEIIHKKGVWAVEILDKNIWCRMADWGGWAFFRNTLIEEEEKYLAEQQREQQQVM